MEVKKMPNALIKIIIKGSFNYLNGFLHSEIIGNIEKFAHEKYELQCASKRKSK